MAATETTFTVNQLVRFTGYADADMAAQPIFSEGQIVRLTEELDNGGWKALPLVAGGGGDTIFPEEVEAISEEEADAAEREAATQPAVQAAPEKGKKGGKKAAAAAAAPEAEATAKAGKKGGKKTAAAPAVTDEEAEASAQEVAVAAVHVPAPAPAVLPPTGNGARTLTFAVGDNGEQLVVVDSPAVASLLEQQDALDAVSSLRRRIEESYFTMGGVLAHIYYEGIHKSAGYEGKRGFSEYVEKAVGIDYRKAMYLIRIYTSFRAAGVDETQMGSIGWSKAKELTQVVNMENAGELLELARTKSREDLVDEIQTRFVDAGDGQAAPRVSSTSFKVRLFADQAETVNRAIDAAKQSQGLDDVAQALVHVCAEWSQLSDGVDVPLEDAIHHLETKYGVRLAVAETAAEPAQQDGEHVAA